MHGVGLQGLRGLEFTDVSSIGFQVSLSLAASETYKMFPNGLMGFSTIRIIEYRVPYWGIFVYGSYHNTFLKQQL